MAPNFTTRAATEQEFPGTPRPHIIFMTDLGGAAVLALLQRPGVLATLAAGRYGVAMGLMRLTDEHAEAARLLHEHGIPAVAWLILPPEQGFTFNSQNYPQAAACYDIFRAWVLRHDLHFDAIGMEVAPPEEVVRFEDISARHIAHRFWIAGENMLFTAAGAAYTELMALMHHDGYEVHAYQLPFIADDRRAGTTLIQRALEIVDMPADLDVLMCPSSVPLARIGGDLGGALIASYGPDADSIGLSVSEQTAEAVATLSWAAIQRDLLLAASFTDIIYVDTLEMCIEHGLLEQITAMQWGDQARPKPGRRAVVGVLRTIVFAVLVTARFGPTALAWSGWVLAALLWVQGRRKRGTQGTKEPRN
jgi:hypothetical protein